MILERYYISKEHWQNVLADWMRKHEVFAPVRLPAGLFMERIHPPMIGEIVLDTARTVQPLKSMHFHPFEDVTSDLPASSVSTLILGARSCDVAALAVLDRVFHSAVPDPHYAGRRQSTLIISADCTLPHSSCFCTSVDINPYAAEGFDLNVSKIWDGFIIEVGSLRGKVLLEGFDRSLKPVVKEEEEAREKLRRETVQRVQKLNRLATLQSYEGLFQTEWDSPILQKHCSACVECGACNFACPTCQSFFLDSESPKFLQKWRGWDSCLFPGYDRTPEGESSRSRLAGRFQHRLLCKFLYQKESTGLNGCTGCGRCIDACPGKIDMRQVLAEMAREHSARAA
jgi:sulfhydrogenase subunit beta (sulfur reductase)